MPHDEVELRSPTEMRDLYGVPLTRTHRWVHSGALPTVSYRGRQRLVNAAVCRKLNVDAEFDPRSKAGVR
jgi:hypothetical protein